MIRKIGARACNEELNVYSHTPPARGGGFTLVELIVTLTVAGILSTFAIPQFFQIIRAQGISSQVNEFVTDINFARSEAIKRAVNIGVCPGTTTAGCTGTWNGGYIVFVDADGDNAWSAGETVLRAREALASGYAITASATTPIIVFSGSGALSVTAANTVVGAGTYAFCRNGVTTAGKQVSLQGLGRVSLLATPPSGSC
jgi:type IV fimbrial biogenesis protein FimT